MALFYITQLPKDIKQRLHPHCPFHGHLVQGSISKLQHFRIIFTLYISSLSRPPEANDMRVVIVIPLF